MPLLEDGYTQKKSVCLFIMTKTTVLRLTNHEEVTKKVLIVWTPWDWNLGVKHAAFDNCYVRGVCLGPIEFQTWTGYDDTFHYMDDLVDD